MKKLLLAIVVMLLLSGCCTTTIWHDSVPPGSQMYREAWMDGCNSGKHDAGRLCYTSDKDLNLYDLNTEYHQGGDTGYKECNERSQPASAILYR